MFLLIVGSGYEHLFPAFSKLQRFFEVKILEEFLFFVCGNWAYITLSLMDFSL